MLDLAPCQCGAVTVYGDDWETSIKEENLKLFFPNETFKRRETTYCNCNHCVNHWGADLCECGSGEEPQECCGGAAMQQPETPFKPVMRLRS
jgi:uncharacterized protein YchJ